MDEFEYLKDNAVYTLQELERELYSQGEDELREQVRRAIEMITRLQLMKKRTF